MSKRSPETSKPANDQQDKEVAQAKPVRGRRHGRRLKNDAKNDEALNSEGASGSNSDPNQAASSNIPTTNSSKLDEGEIARGTNPNTTPPKKPARSRKKTATSSKTGAKIKDADGSLNKVEETPSADNPVTKAKEPAKKAARNSKSKREIVGPVDQPADRKKAAVKKQVRKAAKKAASKPDAKTQAKTNNASSPAVSKTQTSRGPITSAPQDVVKIDSGGTKSPRRGWWSRS